MADPDLESLLAETRVLWGTDSWGRHEEPPLGAVAISAAGHRVIVWPGLDADLAGSLKHMLGSWARTVPAPELRPALESALPMLDLAGVQVAVHGGPSFLVGSTLEPATGKTVVHSSGQGDVRRLAGLRPPNWEPAQWAALLGGLLGPWAMLTDAGEILSICHTPRDSPAGAEAGTWTDPRFRGNGYAAAATAAWAGLLRRRDGRPLFYSTADANHSSRQVAARLGLHPLGWIWSLRPA
jgi:Acetyltransferase (GNAT) domain